MLANWFYMRSFEATLNHRNICWWWPALLQLWGFFEENRAMKASKLIKLWLTITAFWGVFIFGYSIGKDGSLSSYYLYFWLLTSFTIFIICWLTILLMRSYRRQASTWESRDSWARGGPLISSGDQLSNLASIHPTLVRNGLGQPHKSQWSEIVKFLWIHSNTYLKWLVQDKAFVSMFWLVILISVIFGCLTMLTLAIQEKVWATWQNWPCTPPPKLSD